MANRSTRKDDASSGDEWLHQFLRDALPEAFTIARRLCRAKHDAEDAVSSAIEGFIRAFHRGRIDIDRSPMGYLRNAVRNAAHDANRHRFRRQKHPVTVSVPPRTPEEHVDLMLEYRAMTEAFDQLRPRHHECLRLVDEMGGDMAAAGRKMEPALDNNAMRALALRAREALLMQYLEQMAGGALSPECQALVKALIDGRDLAPEQHDHLGSCVACSAAEHELSEKGIRRRLPVVLPVPPLLVARIDSILEAHGAGSGSGGGSGASAGGSGLVAASAACVAVVVAAIAVSSTVWDDQDAVSGPGPDTRTAPDLVLAPPPPTDSAEESPPDETTDTTPPAALTATDAQASRDADTDDRAAGGHDSALREADQTNRDDGVETEVGPGLEGQRPREKTPARSPLISVVVGPGDRQLEVSLLPVENVRTLARAEILTDESVLGLEVFEEKFLPKP